jgi:hypothetical protein
VGHSIKTAAAAAAAPAAVTTLPSHHVATAKPKAHAGNTGRASMDAGCPALLPLPLLLLVWAGIIPGIMWHTPAAAAAVAAACATFAPVGFRVLVECVHIFKPHPWLPGYCGCYHI